MVGFESPGYLWGVLAAAIPLVLHFIHRRKAQVHSFAAMEFLLASNRSLARRMQLKQWLLLAVRMLLIAALPIAFAKPFTTQPATSLVGTVHPASVVFVIDPSMSMGYQTGEGDTLLERAIQRAQDTVSNLRMESDAAVILASSPPIALTKRLTFDREEILAHLESIEATQSSADLTGGLRLAEQLLVESGQSAREVILFTDSQATEWEGSSRPWSLVHAPSVTVVNLAEGLVRSNRAIIDVKAVPDEGGLGRNVRVEVRVLNDQPTAFEDNITVKVGEKVVKGFLRVPPFSEGSKSLSLKLSDMGLNTGVATLMADSLPSDDRRHFVIDLLRRVHVLVVNGSARTVPHRDEAFFLRAALQPGVDSNSRMAATYVKPDEFTPRQLDVVDVVILANVSALDSEQTTAILEWVNNGGGLLFSSGENITPNVYNERLRSLLPLPVRDADVKTDAPVYFTAGSTSHPAMAPFTQRGAASLYSAAVHRHLLFETEASADAQVLLSFTGGAPALVERRLGDGKVLMLATTIDRDWTDLPFKPSYLPLVQQLVLYLAQRLEPPESRSLAVGEAHRMSLRKGTTEVEIVRPSGEVISLIGAELAAGEATFTSTNESGVYTVSQSRGKAKVQGRFAVHIDPRESNLRPADADAVRAIIGTSESVQPADTPSDTQSPEQRDDVWPVVLVALFAILSAETWLAWQVV